MVTTEFVQQKVLEQMTVYAPRDQSPRQSLLPLPSDDDVISVPQRMYSFSRGDSPDHKRYLETLGLSVCIGFTAYDPQTKVGCIAHLDNDNGIKPRADEGSPFLSDVAYHFRRHQSPGPYQVRIVGGWKGFSEETLFPLFETLHYLGSFEIVELAALEPMPWGSQVLSVILDLEDGMLYNSSARNRFNNEKVEKLSQILIDNDITGIYVLHRDLRGL